MRIRDVSEDGVYQARFYTGQLRDPIYRIERIDGEWFFSDGTGWKERIPEDERESLSVIGPGGGGK